MNPNYSLKAVSNNVDELIHKAFNSIEKEINEWGKNLVEYNESSPYLGGSPTYYKVAEGINI